MIGKCALMQQSEHDVLEPVEKIALSKVKKFDILLQ